MRRLRLAPIEEICFQALMQLCGVYHQPQIVMEVMNEMALMAIRGWWYTPHNCVSTWKQISSIGAKRNRLIRWKESTVILD